MIEKNEYYEVDFVDMTHDGMGVCKIDGFPVFVNNALKGETAHIKITKVNKSFGFGRLIELIHKSPFRKEPICEHFYECGGCNLMHMDYQMQLDFKQYRVKETLRKLGKIETEVEETQGMLNPYYYRNKTVVPFGIVNQKLVAGLYRSRSHEIIDMHKCYTIPKITNDIIKFLKNIFVELEIPPYNEDTTTGVIRHAVIRNSDKYDDISITLVTHTSELPKKDIIVGKIIDRYSEVVSIVHNINPKKTNVIFGKKSKLLYGKDYIRDSINDVEFHISHRSFYQINPSQTEKLYEKAIEYAELTGEEVVIDAYCGIGTIGLSAAKHSKAVLGVDVVKSAILDAKNNAITNEITNAKFVTGRAESVIESWKKYKIDVLFIDPPRKGCDSLFLETIAKMKIPRIVYISCNVSTLARDLNYLQQQNYKLEEVTPFDMFPQTTHIETVTKLSLIE